MPAVVTLHKKIHMIMKAQQIKQSTPENPAFGPRAHPPIVRLFVVVELLYKYMCVCVYKM